MSIRATICYSCQHFQWGEAGGEERFAYCRAFPEGIPQEVFYGEFVHKTPYPGDKGFQWEPFRAGIDDDTRVAHYDPVEGHPNTPDEPPAWVWRALKEPMLVSDRVPHDDE